MFEPTSLAPHSFHLLLRLLRAIAAPSMMRRKISSAIRSFSWHTNSFTCPPTSTNQRMSIWRMGWPRMRNLTTNSITSTEVLGHTSIEMRRTAVVLQARLIWPEGTVRPPKEAVAGPVRNAGRSLMLHILNNKCSNSLVADKSALLCSQKAMLRDAWNGMTRISEEPDTDVKTGVFPSHVKVCLFTYVCVSQVDAVPETNDGPILGPRNVGLDGFSG